MLGGHSHRELLTGRWAAGRVALAALLVMSAGLVAMGVMPQPKAAAADFVTRSGSRLMLNGHAFRFGGANVYWGGLDENGRTGLNYPTGFRVRSALAAVADMGETVVRCQTCGISTGNPYSAEPRLGVFSPAALRHIDYFVAQAQRYGIRLDIPLTGNYDYYLGGYRDFVGWLGLSPPGGCPSASCASAFYRDPRAIAAFERYISVLLNHVNVYTGVRNRDNPTIMSWETGSEMPPGTGGPAEFTRWTGIISAHIKSIAPNQLVVDGALTLDPGDLRLPHVDIQSPHLYPASAAALKRDAARVAAAGQALVVGEYPWNSAGLASFLRYVQNTRTISGDLYWDLLPQNDDFGFTEHDDGYQLHFPQGGAFLGADPGGPMAPHAVFAPAVTELRAHAYAMSGRPVPAWAEVPESPVITAVEPVTGSAAGTGDLVEWRGAPGASGYTVRRSASGPNGPWVTVCRRCLDTNGEPFLDSGAGRGVWYQVIPANPDGIAGPASAAFVVPGRTLDDRVRDSAPSGGLARRLDGLRTAEVVAYGTRGEPRLRVLLSANGTDWQPVPDTDVQVTGGPARARAPYLFTVHGIQGLEPGAAYVRVRWDGAAGIEEVRLTGA